MNQIREWLKVISVCKDQIEAIESSYQTMRKGAIHERSLKYQRDRAKSYSEKIEFYGQGRIIQWNITYTLEFQTEIFNLSLFLDHGISEEEIRDRLLLSGYTALELKKNNFINLGFPSFKKNHQIGEI